MTIDYNCDIMTTKDINQYSEYEQILLGLLTEPRYSYETLNKRSDLSLEQAKHGVLVRDKHTCRWLNCGSIHDIHVHHIFPVNEYPALALEMRYMICYCARHHRLWHRIRSERRYRRLIS